MTRLHHPVKTALAVALLAALCGCGMQTSDSSDPLSRDPLQALMHKKPRPSDKLLARADMQFCEQQLGVTIKNQAAAYALSAATLAKIKACAFARERKNMPLLADLISSYQQMVAEGNRECDKNIGTQYGSVCLQRNVDSAKAWYDKAVTQRIDSDLPGQFSHNGE